jgi:hypothetical protein
MNSRIVAVAVACRFALAAPAAAQRPEADLCIVPPGAQPSLPANKLADAQAMEIKGREAWNKADTDLPQLRQATSAAPR